MKIQKELLKKGITVSRKFSTCTVSILKKDSMHIILVHNGDDIIDDHYSVHLNYAWKRFISQCNKYEEKDKK